MRRSNSNNRTVRFFCLTVYIQYGLLYRAESILDFTLLHIQACRRLAADRVVWWQCIIVDEWHGARCGRRCFWEGVKQYRESLPHRRCYAWTPSTGNLINRRNHFVGGPDRCIILSSLAARSARRPVVASLAAAVAIIPSSCPPVRRVRLPVATHQARSLTVNLVETWTILLRRPVTRARPLWRQTLTPDPLSSAGASTTQQRP